MNADDEKLTIAILKHSNHQHRGLIHVHHTTSGMVEQSQTQILKSEINQSANWVCDTPMGSWSTTLAANCFTWSQLAAPRLPDESRMKTISKGDVEQGTGV
jgi:hypothetical protein